MNWLDIVILVPCVWLLIKGFRNGFIVEIAQIISIFISVWVAIKFSDKIMGYCFERFPALAEQAANLTPRLIKVITFIIIMVVVILLIRLLSKLFQKVIEMTALGGLNKLLGGIFGALKGIFIVAILLYITDNLGVTPFLIKEKAHSESFLIKHVEKIVSVMEKNKTNIPFFRQQDDKSTDYTDNNTQQI